jgi:hypothetical protein
MIGKEERFRDGERGKKFKRISPPPWASFF